MNPRFQTLQNRKEVVSKGNSAEQRRPSATDSFGARVFDHATMQRMLPPQIYKNLLAATRGEEKIKPEYADTIAVSMKEWALAQGATHFTHWFQPLTGASAEKHDSFIEWTTSSDKVIETFTGAQLLQGEPDASSFPSGGLRSTYEARGYTGWDPSSPVFIWQGGDGTTLFIPSVFYSWTGDVLDFKIPLLRSESKLSKEVMRLLKLTGLKASHVVTTLGLEQEYFVIDRALRNLRIDLLLTGRTLMGAPPSKGQELQDHYFGAVKDRILSYMHDCEQRALELGIPVKTRHNEVAPAQHEVACVFERAPVAIDHNIIMMELMRQVASYHGLACLLHEKPFHGLNGSGKHANWSLMTDTGINLLNPTDTPGNNLHFLVLLTAILHAIHRHSAVLRASIGSASNDHRLGGHEAPPAIISVYLGTVLEEVLEEIEKKGGSTLTRGRSVRDLGLLVIPHLPSDQTDRNRTSPFAFTGNKFEFRAVGSSSNPSLPITVLNSVVASSLILILDEIEQKREKAGKKELLEVMVPVLQKYLKESKGVRFAGDNYSLAWEKEAKKRGLPILKKSPEAFHAFIHPETVKAFDGVLTKQELASRAEIMWENYSHTVIIEARTLLEMVHTQVLPAAIKTQKDLAKSLGLTLTLLGKKKGGREVTRRLQDLSDQIEETLSRVNDLSHLIEKAEKIIDLAKRAKMMGGEVIDSLESLRESADFLETWSDDLYWAIPKSREILFLV